MFAATVVGLGNPSQWASFCCHQRRFPISQREGGGTRGGPLKEGVGGGRRRINHAEIRLHQNTVQHILDFETSEENNVAVTCGSANDKLEVVQNHQDRVEVFS